MPCQDPAFIEKFYKEALYLLNECRAYLAYHSIQHENSLSPEYSLFITQEITRVTTRVSEIMAWLLLKRSASSVTYLYPENPPPRFEPKDDCLCDSTATAPHPIPPELLNLLNKSRNLYIRLARLETTRGNTE